MWLHLAFGRVKTDRPILVGMKRPNSGKRPVPIVGLLLVDAHTYPSGERHA